MVDNKDIVGNALLRALSLKYQSEVQSARATMMVYLTKAVGIGEHPQHLEEMDKLMESMANASDKLGCLQQYFGENSENNLLGCGVGIGDMGEWTGSGGGSSGLTDNLTQHSVHHYTTGNQSV